MLRSFCRALPRRKMACFACTRFAPQWQCPWAPGASASLPRCLLQNPGLTPGHDPREELPLGTPHSVSTRSSPIRALSHFPSPASHTRSLAGVPWSIPPPPTHCTDRAWAAGATAWPGGTRSTARSRWCRRCCLRRVAAPKQRRGGTPKPPLSKAGPPSNTETPETLPGSTLAKSP